MARHYSPRTPLVLSEDPDTEHRRLKDMGLRVISVGFDLIYEYRFIPNDPEGYASDLYATLHALDAEGWDRIVIELPPDAPEWAGVRDRLLRAAAGA